MSDSSVFLNCLGVCVYFIYGLNLYILCGWRRLVCPGGGRFGPIYIVPSIGEYRGLLLSGLAIDIAGQFFCKTRKIMRAVPLYFVNRPYVAIHNK